MLRRELRIVPIFRRGLDPLKYQGKWCCAKYHSESGVYGYNPQQVSSEPFRIDAEVVERRAKNSNIYRLIEAYRTYGHRQAQLDPLGIEKPKQLAELEPSQYGLKNHGSERFDLSSILNCPNASSLSLDDVLHFLRKVYCGSLAFEFQHVQNEEEREWFAKTVEELSQISLKSDEKKEIASEMLKSQVFDNFLAKKFPTVKRYGGEGAESMMCCFWEAFRKAAEGNIQQFIICMPHRGRLNLLTGMLEFPPAAMFQKMKGMSEFPDNIEASGDVLSHFTSSIDLSIMEKQLHVTMLPNPSHLEAVNPVAVGKTRGKQQTLQDGDYAFDSDSRIGNKVMCMQVHGDAAFTGQGIVMETFTISELPHFAIGGSLHLIVNNQIGFTTPGKRGRSSMYCSDVAKMINVPVIHVNGDCPEDVVKATKTAMDYRMMFRRDIVIDLVCFRRWGHNELDDPTFTNPLMYYAIHNRKSIPDVYASELVTNNVIDQKEVEDIKNNHLNFLNGHFNDVDKYKPSQNQMKNLWENLVLPSAQITKWDTGVEIDLLKYIAAKSVQLPDEFSLHPHLNKTHVLPRLKKMTEGTSIDWSTSETLAVGSLLYQGYNVRLSGQDVGRGTFSNRHVMFVDQKTDDIYIPLNNIIRSQQGFLEIANSPLSEEAVLGFEYGMSIENPNRLVIWEAQFGDFYNAAQVIIDTFISGGEKKWLIQSGLVMLLPHGYDGAGPEHSSSHIERFLQLCDSKEDGIDGDNVNMQIVHPTTPAQYFHLIRRQVIRNFRTPLIVASPKILLRHPEATSSLVDMEPGRSYQNVIGDYAVKPHNVKRVIFCCGKHYYSLVKQRKTIEKFDTAIIRLETLCPFPTAELQKELLKYSSQSTFLWSQEEHQNMGPWNFVNTRFQNLVGCKLTYVGRKPLATPAVGIGLIHKTEAEDILNRSFS